MQFSNFIRTETGNIILFETNPPLKGITNIKYFQDDATGPFQKKEFRWSFNGDYWASWETLNQGNLSGLSIGTNPYLFLEIRYTSAGGTVSSFTINYDGAIQLTTTPVTCPPDSNYISSDQSVQEGVYDSAGQCYTETELVDADTLCEKPCSYYLWRPNHKGEQSIASITDLQKTLNNLSGGIQNSIIGGDNVSGNGIGVFYNKVDRDLLFRRIDASGGINISESSGIITLTMSSGGIPDPSIAELYAFYDNLEENLYDLSIYIDRKFFEIDTSLDLIRATYIPDVSLSGDFSWMNGELRVDVSVAGVNKLYVDGSLLARDASITALFIENDIQDASITALFIENDIQDASIIRMDASIVDLYGTMADISYVEITEATTLDDSHYIVNCTANTFIVSLPSIIQRRHYYIKNTGTGIITVDAIGTIDNESIQIIEQWESLEVVSTNGTNWIIL